MNHTALLKAVLAAPLGLLGAVFGQTGWLVVILIACAAADWLTGSAVAIKQGNWRSRVARDGLWGKMGTFLAVLTAGVFDVLVWFITRFLPAGTLPFTYKTLLLPVVCIWYIATELGSLIENAGALGAPVPAFLRKAVALLKSKSDRS